MAEDDKAADHDVTLDQVHAFKKSSIKRRIERVEELLKRFDNAPYKSEADAADAAIALENLEHGKHYLLQVISDLEAKSPREAQILVHSLEFITHGFFSGLSRAAISESSMRYAELVQAETARSHRKSSPRELVIDAAIDEALVKYSSLSPKPFKIAGMIERRINDLLQAGEYKSVSVDALGKRIRRKTPS